MTRFFTKVVTSASITMILPSLAFASYKMDTPPLAQQNKGVFYVGANVGTFQGTFNTIYNDETDIIAQNIAQPALQNGYTGGLAAGYTLLLQNKYSLGLELAVNLYGNSARFQSGASSAAFVDSSKINGALDLSFVPGVFLADSLVGYVKIGVSVANLSDNLTSPAGYTPTYLSYNVSTNIVGLATGIGIKKYLLNHVSVFSEYNYHDYGNVNFPTFSNFTATYGHTTHIYSSAVTFGATYDF